MISLVLVDFDDTLVDTAPRFQNARRELFSVLSQAGFGHDDIRRVHHEEVDPLMRKRFGLGPQRMEHAFRATYETLCAVHTVPVDEEIAARAAALGRAVAGAPPVIEGSLDALARLARTYPTALYTQAGDSDYQIGCVRECGVLDVIPAERVRICERKTTEQFKRVLADYGVDEASEAWMIGNSMRSDINPALEAGANAIFVEVADPWEFDVVEPVAHTFHKAGSFADAVDLLLGLHGHS